MRFRTALKQSFKRRISQLELIFSDDFLIQFTSIVKREGVINDNPDSNKLANEERYCNCLERLYDIILQYCEENNVKKVDYFYRGKQISNGFVFFYKQPNTSEIELYLIRFLPGQGGEISCFQIFDQSYKPSAIDIEGLLKTQTYRLEEDKELLSKLSEE